ncbi:MAG: type II secretion system F family protein [Faecousia sp.]
MQTITPMQEKKTKLSAMQLCDFCAQTAAMLHSGCSLEDICAAFAQDGADETARAAGQIAGYLDEGRTFAESAGLTGVFPDYALGVLGTAELSGRLDESLERLSDYYRRQEEMQQKMRSSLTYPAALLGMMCVVLGVLVFWVLPMFRGVYDSLTGSLAASAYSYVSAAGVIGIVGLVVSALLALSLLVLTCILGTESGREALRGPLEKLPLTREALYKLALSRLTDTLSTLLASGTDPQEAMETALTQCGHDGLREKLAGSGERLAMGEGFAGVLRGVLPALYARMLRVGETSGSLTDALEQLSGRLGKEAGDSITKLIDSVEPALMGFLTVTVGLTLLSVMLPLLGILGAV